MRTLFLTLLFFCLYSSANAQSLIQFFRSYGDYAIGKSFYAYNGPDAFRVKTTENQKISGQIGDSAVTIPTPQGLWGIQSGKELFRVEAGKLYKVEDGSGLVVYSKIENDYTFDWVSFASLHVQQYKDEEKTTYFFSRDLEAAILPLSTESLSKEVNNARFTQKIKAIKWYKDLTDRDQDNTMLVNRLYRETAR
jgi:hypothetical protein